VRDLSTRSWIALLLGLWAGLAQAAGYVVVIRSADLPPYRAVETAFRDAIGRPSRTFSLASDSARVEVQRALEGEAQLVFAIGAQAARQALDLSPQYPAVPVVYALVPNPEKIGVQGLAPGISMYVSPAVQAATVRALLPKAKRVGVLYDAAISEALVAECDAAAATVGLTLVREAVASRKDVAAAARSLFRQADVVWLIPDTTVLSADTFKFLVQISLETKVPLVGFSEGMTRAGALLSVEAEHAAMGKKAADLARRILGGARPRIESPDASISLNIKSAQLLGVNVPPVVRSQASIVFE
jgi:putative ABC transport system substrate-binding protein